MPKELHHTIETGLIHHRSAKGYREALARYRSIFENAVQGIFCISQAGRFVDANASFANIIGYSSRKELLDAAARAKEHFVSPECHRELLKKLKKSGFVTEFEFEAYRKDGTRIWLSQNTRSIGDPDSNELYYQGTIHDITKQKLDRQAMNALLARQTALLAAIPDIIMEMDNDKIYKWANSAGFDFFGDDVIGKDAAYFIEGREGAYADINSIFRGDEKSIYVENWQRRKDGQNRLLGWHCHVLRDFRGKVTGALCSARDITDATQKERERSLSLARQTRLNQLQQALLSPGRLEEKLKQITGDIVDIFGADFCRIWMVKCGDLCSSGCMYAHGSEGARTCRNQERCLHLICSSGRYTHTNGSAHRRIPFGVNKIGGIASGQDHLLLSNRVTADPGIQDHSWARELNLQSFAGYQLRRPGGEILGVLALFSSHFITPEEDAQLDALSSVAAQLIVAAEAEEALKQSEERFRLIAEHVDEVFWVYEAGNNKASYISPAFERIWGRPQDETSLTNEFLLNAIHPDDRERAISIFEHGDPIELEYRIVRPDGSTRRIWDRGFSIKDDAGQVKCYVGVAQDVTAWREAQEDLKKSKEYLNQIINCIGDPVFVKDHHHKLLMSNDANCAMAGMLRENMIGRTLLDLLPKAISTPILQEEARVLETGQAIVNASEFIDHNGNHRFILVNKTRLIDEHGNRQIVGTMKDITDIKKAEQERANLELQLRQAQKLEAIGQLASGIAHEINTPIQYVSDNMRFLQDSFKDITKIMEVFESPRPETSNGRADSISMGRLESIVASTDLRYLIEEIPQALTQSLEGLNRVATIVRAMKEFSHPGGEEKQATDLNRAISNTITVCRNEWKYVAEMETDLDPELPLVPCLPGDFNQVILNLIVNAAHAIADAMHGREKRKGIIRVSTRQDEDCVEICIADTGTGIPAEHRDKIFTPFFTTKPVGKGTGQGLAISHSVIVGKHRGTINFETETGKGTVFIIRLPLNSER